MVYKSWTEKVQLGKTTQTFTKYHLYSPISKQELQQEYDTFAEACEVARNQPGIWEVHLTETVRKKANAEE